MNSPPGNSQPGCRAAAPDTLAPEDDALLLDLALKIERKGLTAPAVLWLESLRPVSFLGTQFMHFLNPFVRMLYDTDRFERLALILEERAHLERLLRHLEAVADTRRTGNGRAPDGQENDS
jgi:hypothetical protein